MERLSAEVEMDMALQVIWMGICHQCEGGSFKEDFAKGRGKIYDYDALLTNLQRYDHMLFGIELACGSSKQIKLMQGVIQEAIRDCTLLRAEML